MMFQLAQKVRIKRPRITARDVLLDVFRFPHSHNNCAHCRVREDVAQSHLRQGETAREYRFNFSTRSIVGAAPIAHSPESVSNLANVKTSAAEFAVFHDLL